MIGKENKRLRSPTGDTPVGKRLQAASEGVSPFTETGVNPAAAAPPAAPDTELRIEPIEPIDDVYTPEVGQGSVTPEMMMETNALTGLGTPEVKNTNPEQSGLSDLPANIPGDLSSSEELIEVPALESNPVRRSSRSRNKVEHYVGISTKKSSSQKKTTRNTTRGNTRKTESKKTKMKKGVIKGIEKAKDMVKGAIKKLGTFTGTEEKYILGAIQGLKDAKFHSVNITSTMKKNFIKANKEILFGLKNKGIGLVRKMVERDDAGSYQGPSLYGCGTRKKLKREYSWIWCVESEPDLLVRCWGTKVPCGFKLGANPYKNAGDGLNHEMEHCVACVKQSFANLLAQQLGLKDDAKNKFRKYHSILLEIFNKHGIGGDDRTTMVYYIMLMLRRQQVVNGLPSMSLFNQVKCAADLLFFNFEDNDGFMSFKMEYNESLLEEAVKLMEGKSGTLGTCNMIGIKNKDSAYNPNSEDKLREYYTHSYSDYSGNGEFVDLINKAVTEASKWAKSTHDEKFKILTEQCKKISDTYNSMFPNDDVGKLLSGICLASSILVMTVVMKSTYVELGTENPIVPELHVWADKALGFLKDKCGDIMQHTGHIEEQVNNMRESCRYNKASRDYLEMRDTTISDLVNNDAVRGVVNRIRDGQGGGADTLESTQPFEYSPTTKMELVSPQESEARTLKTQGTVVSQGVRPAVEGETISLKPMTPESREKVDIEYTGPDYDTLFGEYKQMTVVNANKWKVFLELMTLRMDESDLLQTLNLFEGCCPDEEDIEIIKQLSEGGIMEGLEELEPEPEDELDYPLNFIEAEAEAVKIIYDEVNELNEKFLCHLSCMDMGDSDYDMLIPESMFNEIENEGIGDLSLEEKGQKKKTKKKRKSKKKKTKRKPTKKSSRKKKRKTTRKKKKQSDLIDKIIDRLGY
jgi:hypothetical protein